MVDGVTFRVDRTQVQQGDTVELALVNETHRVLETGVFGCAGIERQDGETWVVLEEDNNRACILPLYTFDPGQTYRGAFRFEVAPGTVRLVHTYALRGTEQGSTIRSAPIRVIR